MQFKLMQTSLEQQKKIINESLANKNLENSRENSYYKSRDSLNSEIRTQNKQHEKIDENERDRIYERNDSDDNSDDHDGHNYFREQNEVKAKKKSKNSITTFSTTPQKRIKHDKHIPKTKISSQQNKRCGISTPLPLSKRYKKR